MDVEDRHIGAAPGQQLERVGGGARRPDSQPDAVVAVDPFTSMFVQRGGRVIAWEYVESVPEQPIGVFWSKRAWAEKNADTVERFTLPMEEAMARRLPAAALALVVALATGCGVLEELDKGRAEQEKYSPSARKAPRVESVSSA